MTRLRLALAGALALAIFGCRKSLGPPSPDFQNANAEYVQMLSKDGPIDVFTDPDIGSVQALLAKVPADSVDSEAAKALSDTIQKGIADAQKAAAQRKSEQAALAKPLDVAVPSLGSSEPGSGAAPATGTATASGAPPADVPTAGMSAAEFQSKFGACFSKDSPFTDKSGKQGDAYALSASCQSKYPSMANQWVLVSGDKVLGIVPRSTAQQFTIGKAQTQAVPQKVAQAQPAAPQPPAPPPPPVNPNTIDQKVAAPADNVQVPQNLNSDLDAREKLPGEP